MEETSPKLRILILEENDIVRSQIVHVLKHSFDIMEFASVAALTSSKLRFDIALINHSIIRNINAVDILSTLIRKAATPFRAFALVSFYSEAQKQILLHQGFEGVLIHPLDLRNFSEAVYFKKTHRTPTA